MASGSSVSDAVSTDRLGAADAAALRTALGRAMNPFDLPQFLLFYAVLAVGSIGWAVMRTRQAEGAVPPKLDFSDPYAIAYLRGGANEAARLPPYR